MLSFILALFLAATTVSYFVQFFWRHVRIGRVGIFSAHDLSYGSSTCTISTKRFEITLHLPRKKAPYWCILVVEDYEYKDGMCHISIDCVEVKLWFFPVFFRFTGGSWITVTLNGFAAYVPTSQKCPPWIELLRDDLVYTILNGDTIRLHSLNPNAYLGEMTTIVGGNDGMDQNGNEIEGAHHETCLRGTASQWHIFRLNNGRIYTFGDLVAEWRRCSDENRESFVLISREARWTKVPILVPIEGENDGQRSTFRQFLQTVYNLPSGIREIYSNPISTLDLYVPQCDITFASFRLRDAELLRQGATKLKEKCIEFETQNPGVIEDIKWDLFVHALLSFC